MKKHYLLKLDKLISKLRLIFNNDSYALRNLVYKKRGHSVHDGSSAYHHPRGLNSFIYPAKNRTF